MPNSRFAVEVFAEYVEVLNSGQPVIVKKWEDEKNSLVSP